MDARRFAGTLALVLSCGRVHFDANGPGADEDGGDNGACPHMICEDFEDVLDASLWGSIGSVARDTTFAHRGVFSLRTSIPALAPREEAFSRLGETRTLASGSSTFWARGWYRLSGLPVGTNAMELVAVHQTSGPIYGNSVYVHADDTRLYSQFDGGGSSTNLALPTATWFCVIWKVVLATASGTLGLESDVLPPISLIAKTDDTQPPVTRLVFGPYFPPGGVDVAQQALDVWIDDVIVSATPVTCAE